MNCHISWIDLFSKKESKWLHSASWQVTLSFFIWTVWYLGIFLLLRGGGHTHGRAANIAVTAISYCGLIDQLCEAQTAQMYCFAAFSNYKVQHHATDTLVKLTSSVYTCFCNHFSENVIIYNSVHTGKLVNFLYMVYLDTKTIISWYWNRYTIWLNVCTVYTWPSQPFVLLLPQSWKHINVFTVFICIRITISLYWKWFLHDNIPWLNRRSIKTWFAKVGWKTEPWPQQAHPIVMVMFSLCR